MDPEWTKQLAAALFRPNGQFETTEFQQWKFSAKKT